MTNFLEMGWSGNLVSEGGCVLIDVGGSGHYRRISFFADSEVVQHRESGDLGVRIDGDLVLPLGVVVSGGGGAFTPSQDQIAAAPDSCRSFMSTDVEAIALHTVNQPE